MQSTLHLHYLLLVPLMFAHAALAANAIEIQGRVMSSGGRPISGVAVNFSQNFAYPRPKDLPTKTDRNGSFRLREFHSVVFFQHPDYRPLTKVLKPGIRKIEVILEKEEPTTWHLPVCTSNYEAQFPASEFKIGRLIFRLPENTVKAQDIDHVRYFVNYGSKNTGALMTIWEGPNVSGGYPTTDSLASAVAITDRAWKYGGRFGLDMRWRTSTNKVARWMGDLFFFVAYDDVSEDAAKYFDNIIDNVCSPQ